MELSGDLVAIQGILISVIKTTGEFTKINYKGGNEQKILNIMMEIQKFISSKNYIKDGKINMIYDKQIEDIVFFLAINTNCKEPLELEEYYHLMNIMPQLSKCLLANIIYGLDLCKYYCKVLEKIPIRCTIELLEEIIPCLKNATPKVYLENAYMFLKAAANKLMSTEYSEKVEDNVYNISEVTNIILQNLTGLYLDQTRNWKAIQIYQHMGYTLLHLFALLLYCSEDNLSLKRFIENILKTCCSVVKNVTIDVFCSWAEIHDDDQLLQSIISEKAYLVVEKYNNYKEAKELINMLSTIAKKPKTLAERIQEADVSTIINKIYKNDQDQKSWFQALMNTSIVRNAEAMKCIAVWAHLCNESDVTRLLDLSIQSNNIDAKKLALKCASTLTLEQLILVSTQHCYKHKFINVLNEDVQPQLMIMFNKLDEKATRDDDFVKEIYLLLLQNPKDVFAYIYNECLKNVFYTTCLTYTFSSLKEISKIDSIGADILKEVILNNKPDSKNINNYIDLLKVALEMNSFSNEVLFKILLPLLEKCYRGKYFEELNCILQMVLGVAVNIPVTEETRNVIEILLNIMNDCRCIFLDYNNTKQQNARFVVDIIKELCKVNPNCNFKAALMETDDDFTIYYKKYLSSEVETSLFQNIYEEFNIDNYAGCVTELMRILPRSVTPEWLSISEEIFSICSSEKSIELLTDVMILLCQIVKTQNSSTNYEIYIAFKYCIQNFGIVIQKFQEHSTTDEEVNVAKNICRLLRHVPDSLKEEEGLSLVNLLTDRSLKSLANDKEFVCLLVTINNNHICKMLAQKMLS